VESGYIEDHGTAMPPKTGGLPIGRYRILCYSAGMQIKILTTLILCVYPITAFSDDAERVSIGDFLLSRTPAMAPSAHLEYSVASEVDFDAAAGGFSYDRLNLKVPLMAPYHLNNCHAVTLGVEYEATGLQTDTFLKDMDLHDFRLNIRWMYHQPGSKWAWMTRLSPGMATDGEGMDGDDFSLNGQMGFRFNKSPRFAWIGGLVFFMNSMETRIYPGIGFQWRPNDELQIHFSGPTLKVSWQPHEDWILRADIRPGGGNWNVENKGEGFDVKLRSYQAAIGVERRLSDKTWLGLWGGVTFANDLEIETASGQRLFNEDADTGWFVKLGIRRAIW
jgi:hypothetical protein